MKIEGLGEEYRGGIRCDECNIQKQRMSRIQLSRDNTMGVSIYICNDCLGQLVIEITKRYCAIVRARKDTRPR